MLGTRKDPVLAAGPLTGFLQHVQTSIKWAKRATDSSMYGGPHSRVSVAAGPDNSCNISSTTQLLPIFNFPPIYYLADSQETRVQEVVYFQMQFIGDLTRISAHPPLKCLDKAEMIIQVGSQPELLKAMQSAVDTTCLVRSRLVILATKLTHPEARLWLVTVDEFKFLNPIVSAADPAPSHQKIGVSEEPRVVELPNEEEISAPSTTPDAAPSTPKRPSRWRLVGALSTLTLAACLFRIYRHGIPFRR